MSPYPHSGLDQIFKKMISNDSIYHTCQYALNNLLENKVILTFSPDRVAVECILFKYCYEMAPLQKDELTLAHLPWKLGLAK